MLLLLFLLFSPGCSSLGLSLWPSEFPLLKQTKEFAANSPMPSGLPHELAKQVIQDYHVEPGDRLLIEPVALNSNFRTIGDQEILVDGSIDLREFGRLRVTGMTVEFIEEAIENQIEEVSGQREEINVQLVETNASKIYVLGQVGSPGSYPLDGNELVLDGILAAGGLTSEASPCDIILVRPTARISVVWYCPCVIARLHSWVTSPPTISCNQGIESLWVRERFAKSWLYGNRRRGVLAVVAVVVSSNSLPASTISTDFWQPWRRFRCPHRPIVSQPSKQTSPRTPRNVPTPDRHCRRNWGQLYPKRRFNWIPTYFLTQQNRIKGVRCREIGLCPMVTTVCPILI